MALTGQQVLARSAKDPVYFANTFLEKKPHPGQVKWLQNSVQPINVLTPGNRWGKSTIIAIKHIWHAMFKVGLPPMSRDKWLATEYQTLSGAMSADQALIVFREAENLFKSPVMKPFLLKSRSTPFPALHLWNGAIINCRSLHDNGKFVDGHAYRYLSVDEAGWIPDLKGLMNGVLLLRLAGGGNIDLIGTPKGYSDLYFYFNRGERGIKGYYTQRGSIYDNPHLPEEDIKMRDALLKSADPKVREQVLYGAFVDFEGLAFTRDQLDNAFDPNMASEEDYIEGHRYVTAWDLGRTTDFTVGITLDITSKPWRLVNFQRLNKVAWEQIYQLIDTIRRKYHIRWATIDGTGPQGDVIEEELSKRRIPVNAVKINTKQAKVDLINSLQTCFDERREVIGTYEAIDENGMVHTYPRMEEPFEGDWGNLRMPMITQLLDELGLYRLDDKDLVQDSVFALALAVQEGYAMMWVTPPLLSGGLYGKN